MKIPMSWLREFVDLGEMDTRAFMDGMTMSGSKTEALEELGADIKGVVTGRVLSITKHPNADKLFITKIDIGDGNPLQILTAATNLAEGDYVPVAMDGAVLAGGKTIKTGTMRGELSQGMLCSVEELGYSLADYPEAIEDGIYVFQSPVPLGVDPAPILELREDVVEFEITSNRPDCFSVYGIAREAAATFDKKLKDFTVNVKEEAAGAASDLISVEINDKDLCPRYCARVIKDVKISPSPQWLRHRLTAAGLRPINNIVDITNYVMLELGQPMHAFDIETVRGGTIIVRRAAEGEKITTLDGNVRDLDSSMLVIADKERAVAVAGAMGSEDSKITEDASAVLLESASFNGVSVRQTSKALGMRTDASSKFEKGLDPNLALLAIDRAAELIETLGAGRVMPGVVDEYPSKREPWDVSYSEERINALLGTSLTAAEMENLLGRLSIPAKDGTAHIPTYRPDITHEADIAEEVGRIYGYGNIETTLASGAARVGKMTREQRLCGVIREAMTALGYNEALTYAFESPKVFDKLNLPKDSALREAAVIRNPLGEDFSVMRTSAVPAMLSSLSLNSSRRNEAAKLYELARVYLPKTLPLTQLPDEPQTLTLGLYGGDYYDIKGAAEYLLERLGISGSRVVYTVSPDKAVCWDKSLNFLHPGRMAYITADGAYLGYIGELHPMVLENYDIDGRACVCVMYTKALFEAAMDTPVYKPLPKFPGIKRDIAVIADAVHTVGDFISEINEAGGELLEEVRLFDVYQGKNMEAGKRSLAFSLYFRHPERTLTDAEAAAGVKNIVGRLAERFGAVLRDR
ncbi:MAG: phenylalanine--tRNA ligase subunit beta [Clostridiales bacterium]|jgi:phenylalanyl-tRNA synthetase beta chain|nr:phenylalanine--tRNA ligase subunit beta [Clostridiales bacterium]